MKMQQFRRRRTSRALEARLMGAILSRQIGRGKNGVAVVPEDVMRWVRKPRADEPSTGGVYKAMQKEATARGLEDDVSEWMWAVVRNAQQEEILTTAVRRTRNGATEGQRNMAEAGERTGWGRMLNSVMEAVRRVAEAEMGEEVAENELGQLVMRKEHRADVWQAVKKSVPGKGGAEVYKAVLWELAAKHGLYVEGMGEAGSVSGDWEDPSWWQRTEEKAAQLLTGNRVGEIADLVLQWSTIKRRGESGGGEKRYWIHWCAGRGNAVRLAAEQWGRIVIAVDKVVIEPEAAEVRIQLDLSKVSALWWGAEVSRLSGIGLEQIEAMIGGPPCATVAHSDPSNNRNGSSWAYRNHKEEHRPSQHPEGNWRGDLAREHDKVAGGMRWVMATFGVPWLMENPEAYLQKRTYMNTPEMRALIRTVHYCVYWTEEEAAKWRPIKKPTNLWTNVVNWVSRGSTGCGQCTAHNSCCWRDEATGRHESLEGTGSLDDKARTPAKLIDEWVRAWIDRR